MCALTSRATFDLVTLMEILEYLGRCRCTLSVAALRTKPHFSQTLGDLVMEIGRDISSLYEVS
jgi:hypothetical protein